MRRAVLTAARIVLLAGPTLLAFFSGGYFAGPREWAGLTVWALVAVALIAEPDPKPRGRSAWLAIGCLAAFAAWTLLSMTWAPIVGNAYHAGQIVMLYLGALLAAALLLRSDGARKALEPALAAGILIVIGYGLSERLLPGLLHFSRSHSALGRLEQPLTYWNAMGELAAIGFVLAARVAGDERRPKPFRVIAGAAAAPLAAGVYLSVSRGALFACIAGLVALIVLAPRRQQLYSLAATTIAGVLAAVATTPFHGVTRLQGTLSTRERDGAIVFALLAAIALAGALTQLRIANRARTEGVRLPRHAGWFALTAICAGLALAIAFGANEKSSLLLTSGAARYETLQSNRYAYWRVALKAFASQPLHGVGAGNWAVWWLRDRTIPEFAQDAHSLEIQTLAELGVVGLALLAVFLAGIGFSARDAFRASPAFAAGPIAGVIVWIAHSPVDWDWQMPAVTLIAMGLAGALIGNSYSSSAMRGASRLKTQTASTQIDTESTSGITMASAPVLIGALGSMIHLRANSNSGVSGFHEITVASVPLTLSSG
jgi:O-antigen ligase